MKKFYKKYVNVIVCLLTFFLLCKSCQSCNRANQIEYNQLQYEHKLDSINNLLNESYVKCDALQDTITLYKGKLGIMKDVQNTLKENNKALLNSNNHIIRKNKYK